MQPKVRWQLQLPYVISSWSHSMPMNDAVK